LDLTIMRRMRRGFGHLVAYGVTGHDAIKSLRDCSRISIGRSPLGIS